MNLKLKKLEIPLALDNMMHDHVGIAFELTLLTFNIKWEVCSVLHSFLSFSRRYEETKTHNIISLMLDPTFKGLHVVSSIICHEQVGLLLRIMVEVFVSYAFEMSLSFTSTSRTFK
jgi:hypothetical protein